MAQGYWLVKEEPTHYGWSDFAKDGKAAWTGVRNFQARNHLRAMKKGDLVLYYHTGDERAVVGLGEVAREAYPDPTAAGEDFSAVDLRPVRPLPRPVPLADIKAKPALRGMLLVRQGRLSVMPVTKVEFDTLVKMGS